MNFDKLFEALQGYTEKFYSHVDFDNNVNMVASPLGSWLLVASVSDGIDFTSQPQLKTSIELCLGMSVEDAGVTVKKLFKRFPKLSYVAKSWSGDTQSYPGIKKWIHDNTMITHQASIPSQDEIDAWVSDNTKGLIQSFPADMDQDPVLVIANIIYSKLEWVKKLNVVPANESMKTWNVDSVLNGIATRDVIFFEKGKHIYASYLVQAKGNNNENVTLVTCLTKDASPSKLMKSFANMKPSDTIQPNDTRLLDALDGSYGIKEVINKSGGRPWELEVNVPAWEASYQHSLMDNEALGYQEIAESFAYGATDKLSISAKQVAVAKFDKDGFEAAALTSIAVMRGFNKDQQIIYELNFNKPFIFVSHFGELPMFLGYIKVAKEA